LYPEDTQKIINSGVELLMKTRLRLLGKQERGKSTATLKDASVDNADREEEEKQLEEVEEE
jgi:hypothetical protein